MTRLVGRLRAAAVRRRADAVDDFYRIDRTCTEIRRWQIGKFGALWRNIVRDSPYYRRMKNELDLPENFRDFEEFRDRIPVSDRETVRALAGEMRLKGARPHYVRVTGGSTSEPIRLPAWHSEDRITMLDSWRGRSWFGVDASDRLFLLWGHSHLLGEIPGRWLRDTWRCAKDLAFGYRRISAYDLSDEALARAGEALLSFRPAYIIGYSYALHRLARVNRHLRSAFHELNLKVAIATGESFPYSESAEMISDVLGCPVTMEYGSVETGTIAHQRPDNRFQFFWANNLIEGVESARWPGWYDLLVTTLYPRLVPLVRYRIGDVIKENPVSDAFDQTIDCIVGRCNDGIAIDEDTYVHSEAFSHVMKDFAEIQGFQVVQKARDEIIVSYIANESLSQRLERRLRRRFRRVDERLKIARFERVLQLQRTISGKTIRVVNESHARAL